MSLADLLHSPHCLPHSPGRVAPPRSCLWGLGRLPVQYLRLHSGVLCIRYTWYLPGQAFTSTSVFQRQQLSLQWAHAVRLTMPSPRVGCGPFSHMGAAVWHRYTWTQVSGILTPPSPTKRYQPFMSLSHPCSSSVFSVLRKGWSSWV